MNFLKVIYEVDVSKLEKNYADERFLEKWNNETFFEEVIIEPNQLHEAFEKENGEGDDEMSWSRTIMFILDAKGKVLFNLYRSNNAHEIAIAKKQLFHDFSLKVKP